MSKFPKTLKQVLHNYQIELENWIKTAPIENIRDFFITIHGGVYPNDWEDFVSRHYNTNAIRAVETIRACECESCAELLLAIQTLKSQRIELKTFFSKISAIKK